MLSQLVDNSRTDKNTVHSYLDLYETLLSPRKDTAKNVLEVGIGYAGHTNGGSIKLLHDYFQNATIHALDIEPITKIWSEIRNKSRINLYTSIDAYDYETFKNLLLDTNIKFDVLLDDGSHRLDHMLNFVKYYSQIMADDGILIVEDVADITWLDQLKEATPDNLKQYVKFYDLRNIKGRYDDIVFVIDKRNIYN
jgi:hypothetical protein